MSRETTSSRRTFLRRATSTGALATGVGLAGCLGDGGDGGGGGGGGGDGGGTTVDMTDSNKFEPESITVAVGETVTWENVGSIGHTVTAYEDDIPDGATYFASGGFDSEQAARNNISKGMIQGGESYQHTFETAGTYEYFCIPHESAGMKGTVKVTE